MAKALTCPYCYESFDGREILFRCNMRMSRAQRRCPPKGDPVLVARTGNQRDVGPLFAADGRRPAAVCPECEGQTRYRVCPVCHSQLPAQFGQVDHRLIAMIGAKDSGKTVYMTVLLHEVMNRVGERFDASIIGANDDTLRRFSSTYEKSLYERRTLPSTTDRAATRDNRVDPLVFRFSLPKPALFGSAPLHTLLSFFDAAGEDLTSQDSVDVNARYLAAADGIILMLDPLQIPGARRIAAPGTPLPGQGPAYDTPVNVLSRVTELLLAPGTSSSKGIRTPIAIAFSKIDALQHSLARGNPLLAEPPSQNHFDESDSLDVHHETARLLKEWDGVAIDQILRNNYQRYRYFGVSALGRNPTSEMTVDEAGIQPYRVADPFIWLLSEFGAVRRKARAK